MPLPIRTRLALALPVAALSACADLPDLSAYPAATTEVRESVATVGKAVSADINNAAAAMNNDARVKADAAKFDTAWKGTVASMDAMVDYAQALATIAQSGNKGKESAKAVADQVTGLAGALGVTLGPAAAVGAAADTFAFVYGQIAKIRATRSLEAALATSGPAIIRLQGLVRGQIDDARLVFGDAIDAQLNALQDPSAYGNALAVDRRLREREQALFEKLAGYYSVTPSDDKAIAAVRAELGKLTEARTSVTPRLTEYEARRTAIIARRTAGRALCDATDAALEAWGTAHGKLAAAIRDRQPVTLASLTAAVTDLRELIKKWRDL